MAKGLELSVQYADFWEDGGSVKAHLSVSEDAAADGVISLDELIAWDVDWSGNSAVGEFSISSQDGTVTALLPPGGFLVEGQNTAFGPSDVDGLDQGLYESGSGEKTIDLGALIVEDLSAGTVAQGDAAAGSVMVSEVVKFGINYDGFWEGGGSIKGYFSASEADAADGVVSLDELIDWNWNWTGNDEVSAFSISSDDGVATALLPDSGFLLNGTNTAVDLSFNDADGLEQGVYESGDQVLDLGALLVENFAAGTTVQGDAAAGSVTVSDVVDFDITYADFWDGGSVTGTISASEVDAADGVITLDELVDWSWSWSGNEAVDAFSIFSADGSATSLVPPGGFRLDGSNTAVDAEFNDADGLDQGIYESGSGDQVIDLGALLIQDLAANAIAEGDASSGQIFALGSDAPELVSYAEIPADTFAAGPPTGEGIDANGRTGPFEGPPVQGFSGVQFAPGGDGNNYWFLSDNGFGSKANSPDYLLRLYQVEPSFAGSEGGDGSAEVQGFVQLSDPDNLIPFDIQNEGSSDRNLTGSDFDVESFVIDANGDIWIGEEFGPYLLHFDSTGKLVEAPIETPNVFSPDSPAVIAGEAESNLSRSRGYEGMAFSPDRSTLYPMLEGTVLGDPDGSLRIYEFDVASSAFEGLVGLYQMDASNHAIGDFTPINENEFLVIERDGRQAADAAFKKIFKVNLSEVNDAGFVEKELVVDLLNIADPNDLNGDDRMAFDFPFVTIENVLVLDENTILVANDNNFPFSIGRDFSGTEIDNNEMIQIRLNQSLELDERLGVAGFVAGSSSGGSGEAGQDDDGVEIGSGVTAEVANQLLSNNADDGVDIEGDGSQITIRAISSTANAEEGLEIDGSNNEVAVFNASFRSNGGDGFDIDETATGNRVTVRSVAFGENGDDGFDVLGSGNAINWSNVSSTGNAEEGFEIDGDNNIVVLSQSSLSGNGDDGFQIDEEGSGNQLTITNSTIANNVDGIDINGSDNLISLFQVGISDNSGTAVEVEGDNNTVIISSSTFSNNGEFAFLIEGSNNRITISDSAFLGSGNGILDTGSNNIITILNSTGLGEVVISDSSTLLPVI